MGEVSYRIICGVVAVVCITISGLLIHYLKSKSFNYDRYMSIRCILAPVICIAILCGLYAITGKNI